jgi:hypothetical protein
MLDEREGHDLTILLKTNEIQPGVRRLSKDRGHDLRQHKTRVRSDPTTAGSRPRESDRKSAPPPKFAQRHRLGQLWPGRVNTPAIQQFFVVALPRKPR